VQDAVSCARNAATASTTPWCFSIPMKWLARLSTAS